MRNVLLFLALTIICSTFSLAQEASSASAAAILAEANSSISNGDREKAKELLESLRGLTLTDYQQYELQLLLRQLSKHQVALVYEIINFQEAYPIQKSWNSLALEYQHNIGKQTFLGRATYSDRFFADAVLYEIDAYPVFSEKMYAYVSLAASEGEFFQKLGASASVFYNLGKGFESEIG
ncbi:MAG: YaiO family outer membrane beta-barrel protein, partial [Marinirhabdus sp.]|nr:YaiO family outer membrane beta-barrel protein [Marinirhabdus sp.]